MHRHHFTASLKRLALDLMDIHLCVKAFTHKSINLQYLSISSCRYRPEMYFYSSLQNCEKKYKMCGGRLGTHVCHLNSIHYGSPPPLLTSHHPPVTEYQIHTREAPGTTAVPSAKYVIHTIIHNNRIRTGGRLHQ